MFKLSLIFVALLVFVEAARADDSWRGWGGPNGDFKVSAARLSEAWPALGPKKIWDRTLGDGLSAIVVDADRLYTMYRAEDEEIVIALEAGSGNTLWEHRYAALLREGKRNGYLGNNPAYGGKGPRATPLVDGNRLYTVGYTAKLHCFDTQTGGVLWSHDLIEEFEGWVHECGYSSSPILYRNMVIVLLGSSQHGVVAFDRETGDAVWKSPPFAVTAQESQGFQATPIVIQVDGEDQLVFMSPTEAIGLDPTSGGRKWSHPHRNTLQYNCVTPVWDDGLLYVTSHGDAGSRVLRVGHAGGRPVVTQLWHNHRIALFHNNGIQLGDHVYGCSGRFLYAQNVQTGEAAWKERGFSEANLIHADGKLIILDETGALGLATVSPEQLTLHGKFQLFGKEEGESWTPPTLVGTTLYAQTDSAWWRST